MAIHYRHYTEESHALDLLLERIGSAIISGLEDTDQVAVFTGSHICCRLAHCTEVNEITDSGEHRCDCGYDHREPENLKKVVLRSDFALRPLWLILSSARGKERLGMQKLLKDQSAPFSGIMMVESRHSKALLEHPMILTFADIFFSAMLKNAVKAMAEASNLGVQEAIGAGRKKLREEFEKAMERSSQFAHIVAILSGDEELMRSLQKTDATSQDSTCASASDV